MSSTPPPADFGILLAIAYRCYVDELHERLRARGFEPRATHGPVLRALASRTMTLTELARHIGVSKQAASRVVEQMRVAGLVDQHAEPADGRARRLSLTARGRAMVALAIEIGGDVERRLGHALGDDAVRQLRAALEQLVAAAGASDQLAERRVRALA